jgi:lysozyme
VLGKFIDWLKSKRNYTHPDNLPQDREPGWILKQHYEGCEKKLPNGLIAPYLDAKGIPTIGWGNTYWENGTPVRMTDAPITQARADALGEFIWHEFKRQVKAIMPLDTPERHLSVFTSFAYNIGIGEFGSCTAFGRYSNGDIVGAGEAMEWYNKSGGVVLKGLQRRRRAEHYVLDGMHYLAAIKQAEVDYP